MHIFKEIQILRDEGKLHSKLINRVRMLFVISLILAAIVIFNIIFRDVNAWIVMLLALIGLPLGIFVFSRMSNVQWNEEEGIVKTGRMDMVGYITLALYIGFELILRTFLKDYFPASETVFVLAAIFGTLFGRALGTLVEIHRVYRSTHPEE